MSLNTGWDDPTEVNWDNDQEEEEEKEEPIVPEPKEAIFKCTALYSYTVSSFINLQNPLIGSRIIEAEILCWTVLFISFFFVFSNRHKIQTN